MAYFQPQRNGLFYQLKSKFKSVRIHLYFRAYKKHYTAEFPSWSKILSTDFFGSKDSKTLLVSHTYYVSTKFIVNGYMRCTLNRANMRIDDISQIIYTYLGVAHKFEHVQWKREGNCAIILYENFLYTGIAVYFYDDRRNDVYDTWCGVKSTDISNEIKKIKRAFQCPIPMTAINNIFKRNNSLHQHNHHKIKRKSAQNDYALHMAIKGDHIKVEYYTNEVALGFIPYRSFHKKEAFYLGDKMVRDLNDGNIYSVQKWMKDIKEFDLEISYNMIPQLSFKLKEYLIQKEDLGLLKNILLADEELFEIKIDIPDENFMEKYEESEEFSKKYNWENEYEIKFMLKYAKVKKKKRIHTVHHQSMYSSTTSWNNHYQMRPMERENNSFGYHPPNGLDLNSRTPWNNDYQILPMERQNNSFGYHPPNNFKY